MFIYGQNQTIHQQTCKAFGFDSHLRHVASQKTSGYDKRNKNKIPGIENNFPRGLSNAQRQFGYWKRSGRNLYNIVVPMIRNYLTCGITKIWHFFLIKVKPRNSADSISFVESQASQDLEDSQDEGTSSILTQDFINEDDYSIIR